MVSASLSDNGGRSTDVAVGSGDMPDAKPGDDEQTAGSRTGDAADMGESLEARCARIAAKHQLSARETEVFLYLAQGHTRASIAKKLFVSENTIREHVKSIYKKLYIHSRQQLIDMVDARR